MLLVQIVVLFFFSLDTLHEHIYILYTYLQNLPTYLDSGYVVMYIHICTSIMAIQKCYVKFNKLRIIFCKTIHL